MSDALGTGTTEQVERVRVVGIINFGDYWPSGNAACKCFMWREERKRECDVAF